MTDEVSAAKLDVCDIKFVTAYLDKIKSKTLNREQISIERTIFEKLPKTFRKKIFCGAFFQKRSAVPTAKLGHSGIKFQAANPDGKELLTVERTIFEK